LGSTIALELHRQQKLKTFLHSSQEQMAMRYFWESIQRSNVKFQCFLAFLVGLFFGCIHFHAGPCCRPRRYHLVIDLISTDKKLATKQDHQTMQNFAEKQFCHFYIA